MNTKLEREDTVALDLNEDDFPTSRDVYQANEWDHTLDAIGFPWDHWRVKWAECISSLHNAIANPTYVALKKVKGASLTGLYEMRRRM